MIKIADIRQNRNGRKVVDFFELGVYDTLKKLGFRYCKIKNRGYYLREKNGIYKIVSFYQLKDSFVDYIRKEFDNLEFSAKISLHDFLNEYYKKRPIKNGNYARDYLSEDFQLSDTNLHLLMLEIDPKYKFVYDKQTMLAFLRGENFVQVIDRVGNFKKNQPLFYKKSTSKEYLVVNLAYEDPKSKQATFDFWKIEAENEKIFLENHTDKMKSIRYGFDLDQDISLYRKEIEKKESFND